MTEQEIERSRKDYAAGYLHSADALGFLSRPIPAYWNQRAEEAARKAYPDPPKPREIIVKGFSFRSVNGELQTRSGSSYWAPSYYSAEEIRALNDLLERPNE